MKPAPERTLNQSRAVHTAPRVALSNSVLDEMAATFEKQTRQFDAAFKSATEFADVQVAVRSDLLEAIDRACSHRASTSTQLLALTRC